MSANNNSWLARHPGTAADPLEPIRESIILVYRQSVAERDAALQMLALFLLCDLQIRRKQVGLPDRRNLVGGRHR